MAEIASPSDLEVGLLLGNTYRIVRIIGKGGMATVYEATHARIERRFAIKVLQVDIAEIPEMLVRFEREARIGSKLGHDHIVQVFDFDQTPAGQPFLVMELLEGEDLHTLLKQERLVPVEWALAVMQQMISALTAAHDSGVVHRDLKPENIFLCGQPRQRVKSKMMDFGISKLHSAESFVTRDSAVFGTPWYMSPEQAQGRVKEIDLRSDIYSAGVILYLLLGGKLPFEGPSIPSVLYQIVHEEPEPLIAVQPALHQDLTRIVSRAMAKQPADRYQSAAEMLVAFKEAMGQKWKLVQAWCQPPDLRDIPLTWSVEDQPPGGAEPFATTIASTGGARAARPPRASSTRSTLSGAAGEVTEPGPHAGGGPGRWRGLAIAAAAVIVLAGVGALVVNSWSVRPGASTHDARTGAPTADDDLASSIRGVAPADASQVSQASPDGSEGVRALDIHSKPKGARIVINGRSFGVTPARGLTVPRSALTITLSKAGHARASLRVEPGAEARTLRRRLTPLTATLTVQASYNGKTIPMDVLLNNRRVDQTPAFIRKLKPGKYTLRVQGKGFKSRAKRITLRPGDKIVEVFHLRK